MFILCEGVSFGGIRDVPVPFVLAPSIGFDDCEVSVVDEHGDFADGVRTLVP